MSVADSQLHCVKSQLPMCELLCHIVRAIGWGLLMLVDVARPPLRPTVSSARRDSAPKLYWNILLQILNVACSQGNQSNHRCQGGDRRICSHCSTFL
jgi:hypothetical protein